MITPDVDHALRHYIIGGMDQVVSLIHSGKLHADLAAIEIMNVSADLTAALVSDNPTAEVDKLLQSMADSLDGKPVPEHTDYTDSMSNDDVVRGFRNSLLGDIQDTIEGHS